MTDFRTTQEKFDEFAADNPQVLVELVRLARKAKAAGFEHYSMKALFEIIRWNRAMQTDAEDFKLNNNYTAYYARLIDSQYDDLKGFFHLRGKGAPEIIEEPDLFVKEKAVA